MEIRIHWNKSKTTQLNKKLRYANKIKHLSWIQQLLIISLYCSINVNTTYTCRKNSESTDVPCA